MRGLRRAGVSLLVAASVAWVVASCGGSSAAGAAASGTSGRPRAIGESAAAGSLSLAGVRVVPSIVLGRGARTIPLPSAADVSFDLTASSSGARVDGVAVPAGGPRHVELARGTMTVDGRVASRRAPVGGSLTFAVTRGRAHVDALIVSPASESGALLFHRLAELHARVPAGLFPTGATLGDRLYYDPGWTSGFYAGALWQAAALEPAGGMFARWALTETIEHFGSERAPTHDVGFMYGQSSLNAWEALCGAGVARRRRASPSLCGRLRSSVVSAADELLALAGTNPVAGTIPTDPTSPEAETIVDSMMNIAILPWATTFTGNQAYVRLARHQASVIARALVRANGSTAQSANFDRATGRLISVTTHQGLSNTSTWARGEGWAVYGFAVAASELRSPAFLHVAERVAGYVAARLPAGGVPRWDYDAPAGAPVDVSAGVITATGLLHLVAACRRLEGASACAARALGWTALARRMLAAAVGGYAAPQPPLGLLRSQIEDQHFRGCWCNHGELIYGLSYALEGLRLLQSGR